MTLEAIVTKSVLEEFVDPLAEFVDEAAVDLTESGLEVEAVDPANVAQIEESLSAEAFESYEAQRDRVGFNISRFDEALGYVDSGQLVHLEISSLKLRMEFGDAQLEIATIDPGAIRHSASPDLDLPVHAVPDGDQVAEAVDILDFASEDDDSVRIQWKNDELQADAMDDTDSASVAYERSELIAVTHTAEVESNYSLPYLKSAAKPLAGETEVDLALGDGKPLELDYGIADGRGSVTVRVAPRVDGGDA